MHALPPSFASDPATASYYDRRANEYDEWYLGTGQFVTRERPGWHEEVERVVDVVANLPAARTLGLLHG